MWSLGTINLLKTKYAMLTYFHKYSRIILFVFSSKRVSSTSVSINHNNNLRIMNNNSSVVICSYDSGDLYDEI